MAHPSSPPSLKPPLKRGLTFAKAQSRAPVPSPVIADLTSLLGAVHVRTEFPVLFSYARDRLPWGTFNLRDGRLPGALPSVVIAPGSHDEVREAVRIAVRHGCPMIPFGAGSGVLGGTIPLGGEIVVDLKRLNRIEVLHETDAMVTVQAGMHGGEFERQLNDRGFICGHYPQSLNMSTVGGWVACRGAGQASTRYGKIEDMVLGLRAVLPTGEELEVRAAPHRAVGPGLKDLLVGSEGTLGAITSVTLRVWPAPAEKRPLVLAFPTLAAAIETGRRILQAELRPAVFRVYDDTESKARANGDPLYSRLPILSMYEFHGDPRLVSVESDMAMEIAHSQGAEAGGRAPFDHWLESRYESYSARWQTDGYFMDTVEISAPWSRALPMYESMRLAVRTIDPAIYFGTHWSHAYAEGVCQYMTMRLPPMPTSRGLELHERVWDCLQSLCLEQGGSISHHHGIGLFRGKWFRRELGSGHGVFASIKRAVDPHNLFNPGKLGL